MNKEMVMESFWQCHIIAWYFTVSFQVYCLEGTSDLGLSLGWSTCTVKKDYDSPIQN